MFTMIKVFQNNIYDTGNFFFFFGFSKKSDGKCNPINKNKKSLNIQRTFIIIVFML